MVTITIAATIAIKTSNHKVNNLKTSSSLIPRPQEVVAVITINDSRLLAVATHL